MNEYTLTDDGESLEKKEERKSKPNPLFVSTQVLLIGLAMTIITSGIFTILPTNITTNYSYEDYIDRIYSIHTVTRITLIIFIIAIILIKILLLCVYRTSTKIRFFEIKGILYVERFNKSLDRWEQSEVVEKSAVIVQRFILLLSVVVAVVLSLGVIIINLIMGRF